MIVIFRRIREAAGRVTGTEWLLVAVEGLLVFVGIVAAFQLQEWATDRREEREIERTMREMVEESRIGIVFIDQRVREFASYLERSNAAALQLGQGQCPAADGFAAFENLEFFPPLEPPHAVYDELVAGVGLSAIPDYDARFAISVYRQQFDMMRANNVRFNDLERFTDVGDVRQSLDFTLETGEDRLNFVDTDYDRDALCADRTFRNRVAWASRAQNVVQGWREELLGRAAYMCQALADQVGEQCLNAVYTDLLGKERAEEIAAMGETTRARFDNY